jgi:hypothetical protein
MAPVVARGRWVEIATNRDEPVCAGTVAYMDALIEAGFELLGEAPPDRVFVRYEWSEPDEERPLIPTGYAQPVNDDIWITSNRLVHEHELVHAVHLHAWPRSASFMHEGLAVLLDAKRLWLHGAGGLPRDVLLDDVLTITDPEPADYDHAWFLVSQIVFDHGLDGLRDFWHAVPPGATAQHVRAAYMALFDRSIDALIEPYHAVNASGDDIWIERGRCSLNLCPGSPKPWAGDVWSASGPTGCQSDPQAVGPMTWSSSLGIGSVWRPYVVEFAGEEDGEFRPDRPRSMHPHDLLPNGGAGALLEACWFECATVGTGEVFPDAPRQWQWGPGRFRVEVLHELDDLPLDPPGELHIHRHEP